ncbi:hypothetical protein U1Q18_023227 [Sarracenia purpurea var. burkii]
MVLIKQSLRHCHLNDSGIDRDRSLHPRDVQREASGDSPVGTQPLPIPDAIPWRLRVCSREAPTGLSPDPYRRRLLVCRGRRSEVHRVDGGWCQGLMPRFGLVVGRRGWRQRKREVLHPIKNFSSPIFMCVVNFRKEHKSMFSSDLDRTNITGVEGNCSSIVSSEGDEP